MEQLLDQHLPLTHTPRLKQDLGLGQLETCKREAVCWEKCTKPGGVMASMVLRGTPYILNFIG